MGTEVIVNERAHRRRRDGRTSMDDGSGAGSTYRVSGLVQRARSAAGGEQREPAGPLDREVMPFAPWWGVSSRVNSRSESFHVSPALPARGPRAPPGSPG